MTATAPDPNALLEKHRERLDSAVRASATRGYYAAFDESPSPRVYGETAARRGHRDGDLLGWSQAPSGT